MIKLNEETIKFLHEQSFVIVSTICPDGSIHNACKGIINIEDSGKVYLFDLYRGKTFNNLAKNYSISLTAVDEHKFKGYCVKGKAKTADPDEITPDLIRAWEDRIASRITKRLLKNIQETKGHPKHPEASLPKPEYVIIVSVESIEDLTPHHLK